LFTIDLTWTGLQPNTAIRDKGPSTDSLGHGTALKQFYDMMLTNSFLFAFMKWK
jgi:hypothetical protein